MLILYPALAPKQRILENATALGERTRVRFYINYCANVPFDPQSAGYVCALRVDAIFFIARLRGPPGPESTSNKE